MEYLDFEKPIVELESRLKELKELASRADNNMDQSITDLEVKIQALKTNTYQKLTRWQRVQLSRHPNRPYTLDYLHTLVNDFLELHGDRLSYDDPAIVGGFGKIENQTFMFVGQQKRAQSQRT